MGELTPADLLDLKVALQHLITRTSAQAEAAHDAVASRLRLCGLLVLGNLSALRVLVAMAEVISLPDA